MLGIFILLVIIAYDQIILPNYPISSFGRTSLVG